MGLFDDAIREHLDLRRRHGADPKEVEQLEREVLGPVRRGAEETDPLESGADFHPYHKGEPQGFSGHQSETLWDDEYEGSDGLAPEYEDELPEHESALRSHRALGAPNAHSSRKRSGEEISEFDVGLGLRGEPEDKKDDVLEETPEFLQDAPDHDRLWFEQRPPRDFDFDG